MKLIHFGVAAREGLTTNCLVTTEYRPFFASRRIISVFTVAVNEARTSVMEVTVRYTCDSTHDAVPDDGCNGYWAHRVRGCSRCVLPGLYQGPEGRTLCVRLRSSSTVPRGGCSIRPMIAAVSLLPVPGLDGVPQPYPTAVCAGGNGGPGPAACGVRRRRGGVSWLRCLEAPRPGRNRAV